MGKLEEYDEKMKGVESKEVVFHDPKKEPFKVEGLAWFKNHQRYFRLPSDVKEQVSEAVWWLSSHPAGGQIRFKSNTTKITLKLKNTDSRIMCHMAATGQQGVDCYFKEEGERYYHFYSVTKFETPTKEITCDVFKADHSIEREFILNLPLYQGLEDIQIGLDENASLEEPSKHAVPGKVVIYGTSVTQGGCASRPGMLFTNILSRKIDTEFINLGFSGSGLGEVEMAKIIAQIDDVSLFVLDYDANGGSTGVLEAHMVEFIEEIRKLHPTTPILVMSKIPFSVDYDNKDGIDLRNRLLAFQRKTVANFRMKKGDMNIYFYDGNNMFGEDDVEEMTVDGYHPTDLGFYLMAKNIMPVIKRLLKVPVGMSLDEAKEIEKKRKEKELAAQEAKAKALQDDDDETEEESDE